MTTRENPTVAPSSATSAQTPFFIYSRFFAHPRVRLEDWRPLFEQGLGVTLRYPT